MSHPKLQAAEIAGTYRIRGTVTGEELLAMANHLALQRLATGTPVCQPQHVFDALQNLLQHREREIFAVLFLDCQHRILAYEELFFGSLSCAAVYPREVVKRALHFNAGAVILVHNHPSGVAEPSQADRQLTHSLSNALMLVDVQILDHLVVSAESIVSMAQRGLLQNP